MKQLRYFLFCILIMPFQSCEEGGLLIETDISEREVVLTAPSDGVEVAANTVFFDWEEVEDATVYEIQVATPDFDNTQQLLLNLTDSVTFNELDLVIGDYEWRVKAKNSSSETNFSTAGFKVVPIESFSDNVVQLISPEDNFVTNVPGQTLQWDAINGATLYRIQILENGTLTEEQATNENEFDITFNEGTFVWQIRAENGTQSTLYSSRDILVDTTNPNIPSLTLPEDGSELTSQQVSFQWIREAMQGSVEFDSIYIYRDLNLTELVLKDRVTSPYETNLDNDTYYWFVQAFDEAGNDSDDSAVFNFTVKQ